MNKVSLTMIVKNEERCIKRCLESVKPWVDDMIVLDTGSTDRTMEIARSSGARVYQSEWGGDFSKARNEALSKSTADWNVILDADEWIFQGGEYLSELKKDNRKVVHTIRIDSSLGDEATTLHTSSHVSRILPKGVRYVGRVHEQPFHQLEKVSSRLIVRHDGYMRAQAEKKIGRNMMLLLEQMKDSPGEAYYAFQLGKEYSLIGDHEKAVEYYKLAYSLIEERPSWIHDLIIQMIESKRSCGRIEEAMIFASDEMPHWNDSPDFNFVVGGVLLEQMSRRPEQGAQLLSMMEQCWLKALSLGDSTDLPGSVRGRGSFMPAQKLWAIYSTKNDMSNALKYEAIYKQLYEEYQKLTGC